MTKHCPICYKQLYEDEQCTCCKVLRGLGELFNHFVERHCKIVRSNLIQTSRGEYSTPLHLMLIMKDRIDNLSIEIIDDEHFRLIDIDRVQACVLEHPKNYSKIPAPMRIEVIKQDMIGNPDVLQYIFTSEGWISDKAEIGHISELPLSERQEVLTIVARSRDGKENYQKVFEIKRQVHGDETTKVIDLIDMNVTVSTPQTRGE